ncbi:hypothetical protein Hanom_Chr16g01472761 [Helianthus anomalus]
MYKIRKKTYPDLICYYQFVTCFPRQLVGLRLILHCGIIYGVRTFYCLTLGSPDPYFSQLEMVTSLCKFLALLVISIYVDFDACTNINHFIKIGDSYSSDVSFL